MAYGPGSAPPRWPWPSILGWAAAALGVLAAFWVSGLAGSDAELRSASPSPSPDEPLPIRFGTRVGSAGEAQPLTTRFRAGDAFVYSVRLPNPPGRDTVRVEIVRVEGEQRTVVQEPSAQGIDPTTRIFAFEVRAVDLIEAWGPGEYDMRIFWPGADDPFAAGHFMLVESPAQP